jgi:hypothetical protein
MPKASGWERVRESLADAEKAIRQLHQEMDQDLRQEHPSASNRVDFVRWDHTTVREPVRQGA